MTRAAEKVNEKVASYPRKVSTQWWFDHVATPKDLVWQVEMQDFMAARKELLPSVSAEEQETYRRLQSQFSAVKTESVRSNGTGKGKGKEKEGHANGDHDEGYELDGKTWVGKRPIQLVFRDDHDEDIYA